MHRAIIVKDEPIERQALVLMLRHHFSEVEVVGEAGNGFDALAQARKLQPDIVLMDVGIPGINGLETIRQLSEEAPDISFIIISSHDNFEYAQQAIQLGVEDYLLKPVNVETLRKVLGGILQKHSDRQQEKHKETALFERMEKIRPIVVNDLIYNVTSGGPAAGLQQLFAFLGEETYTGLCLVLMENDGFRRTMLLLEQALRDVGYHLVCGFYNNASVFCVLLQDPADEAIDELLGYSSMVLKNHGYQAYSIGAGRLVQGIEGWHEGYRQALQAMEYARGQCLRLAKYAAIPSPVPATTPGSYLPATARVLARTIVDHNTADYDTIIQQALHTLR